MAVNSIGDFIRGVFPSTVDVNGTVFKALLSDKENKNGTVEKVFSDIEEERKAWCNSSDVWNQTGEQFEKTMGSISALNMTRYETEDSYKKRNKYIFCRMGSEVHGTVFDIKRIFEDLLSNNAYIVNNSMEYDESVLINGNCEDYSDDSWVLSSGCDYDKSAAFEGNYGLLFSSKNSTAVQESDVDQNSTYCLHAFCKGKLSITITDDLGRYYHEDTGTWSNTRDSSSKNILAEEWRNESVIILTDNLLSSITITFTSTSNDESAIDYVRMFKKDSTSCFSLIVSFSGAYTSSTLHLAPNEEGTYDPAKQSYINQTFIYGGGGRSGTSMFSELLDVVKPFGVHSSLEILTAN